MENILLILFLLLLIFIFLYFRLRKKYQELLFLKKSQASRYGKLTEQFLPFLKDYPYASENFRFIGTPIDGLQFEDDKIIFIEFKTGNSELSEKQKEIAQLVKNKKVFFEEHRIE